MPIHSLKSCDTLDKLLDFVEEVQPQVGMLGGRRYVSAPSQDNVSLNEIVQQLETVYYKTELDIEKTQQADKIIAQIKTIDQQANELIEKSSWFIKALTKIKQYIGNFNYSRNNILCKIDRDNRTNSICACLRMAKNLPNSESNTENVTPPASSPSLSIPAAPQINSAKETSPRSETPPKDDLSQSVHVESPKNVDLSQPAHVENPKNIDLSQLRRVGCFLRMFTGPAFQVYIPSYTETTIGEFVALAAAATHHPISSINLIYAGKLLNKEENLNLRLRDLLGSEFKDEQKCFIQFVFPSETEALSKIMGEVTETIPDRFPYDSLGTFDEAVLQALDGIHKQKFNQEYPLDNFLEFLGLVRKKADPALLPLIKKYEAVIEAAKKLYLREKK